MATVDSFTNEARARAIVAEKDAYFRKSGPPSYVERSLFMVAIVAIAAFELCSMSYVGYVNYTKKGKEIPVWYHVPLCPAVPDRAITTACPDCSMFASRDVGVEVCPSQLQLDQAGAVSYRVPVHFFDAVLPYKPALFYPDSLSLTNLSLSISTPAGEELLRVSVPSTGSREVRAGAVGSSTASQVRWTAADRDLWWSDVLRAMRRETLLRQTIHGLGGGGGGGGGGAGVYEVPLHTERSPGFRAGDASQAAAASEEADEDPVGVEEFADEVVVTPQGPGSVERDSDPPAAKEELRRLQSGAAAAKGEEGVEADPPHSPAMRRLLKGSSGSRTGGGRLYRDQYAGVTYMGPRPYRTPYGWRGRGALADMTVVHVVSRAGWMGARTDRGFLSGVLGSWAGDPTAQCRREDSGCEVRMRGPMTRDVPDTASFRARDGLDSLVLTVRWATALSPRGAGLDAGGSSDSPPLFVTLFTDETSASEALADGLFVLAIIVGILGIPLACCLKPCFTSGDGDLRSLRFSWCRKSGLLSLSLKSNDIISMDGIETMPNLRSLNVEDNDLVELQGIGAARHLEYLNIRNNDVRDMAGVETLTRLRWLDARSNDLTCLRALGSCHALTYLDAADNDLTHVRPLASLRQLTYLNLENNDLTDVSGVERMPHLRYLNLSNNDLRSVATLAALQAPLEVLLLDRNDLANAAEVRQIIDACDTLRVLDVRGNDFSEDDRATLVEYASARLPDCIVLV